MVFCEEFAVVDAIEFTECIPEIAYEATHVRLMVVFRHESIIW